MAVDAQGNVYVADTESPHPEVQHRRRYLAQWGSIGSGNGQFSYPDGVAVDGPGNVYVADTGNHRIQKFTTGGAFIAAWADYLPGRPVLLSLWRSRGPRQPHVADADIPPPPRLYLSGS